MRVPMRAVPARHAQKAFTLVELLVVLGIVALLVALLFPAFSKARRQAAQVTCLSNLRQLGIALVLYTNENRGRFPAPASALQPQPDDWVHWPTDARSEGEPFVGLSRGQP